MKRLKDDGLVLMDTLDQSSKEWLEWRGQGIGSSDIALLMDSKPLFDRTVGGLWRQKLGYERAVEVNNEHVKRGKDLEPIIRDKVNSMFRTKFEPLCALRTDAPYLRASLDGWDAERDIILEIKAPSDKVFQKYLDTWEIPINYWYQMQYQMLVTNCEYGIFAFYNAQVDENGVQVHPEPYIMHVENDHELQLDIERRCALFWQGVQSKIPVGWDGDTLKMFHTRPTAFVFVCNREQMDEFPRVTGIQIVDTYNINSLDRTSLIALMHPDSSSDLLELKDHLPEHEIKIINLTPSQFSNKVDEVELTEEGILEHLKTLV